MRLYYNFFFVTAVDPFYQVMTRLTTNLKIVRFTSWSVSSASLPNNASESASLPSVEYGGGAGTAFNRSLESLNKI